MEEEYEKRKFWLPSEFLVEDLVREETEEEISFPSEFPYEVDGSSVGSRESDEDCSPVAGITRQMSALAPINPKVELASSPQSTLCSDGNWSKSPSQVSSPPSPLESNDPWGLLTQEGEEKHRRNMSGRGLLSVPKENTTLPFGFHSNPPLTRHQLQLQITRFQQLKQQQLPSALGRHQTRGRNGRVGRPMGVSSPWSPFQSHHHHHHLPPQGSGMRAIFLSGSGNRRESGGTGVFLPRRTGSPIDMSRKPACSTVILPARVVQALNLDFDEIGTQPLHRGGLALDHDAIRARSYAMLLQRKRMQQQTASKTNAGLNHEIRLPPEWTY